MFIRAVKKKCSDVKQCGGLSAALHTSQTKPHIWVQPPTTCENNGCSLSLGFCSTKWLINPVMFKWDYMRLWEMSKHFLKCFVSISLSWLKIESYFWRTVSQCNFWDEAGWLQVPSHVKLLKLEESMWINYLNFGDSVFLPVKCE